jgi:hypothetical protein
LKAEIYFKFVSAQLYVDASKKDTDDSEYKVAPHIIVGLKYPLSRRRPDIGATPRIRKNCTVPIQDICEAEPAPDLVYRSWKTPNEFK